MVLLYNYTIDSVFTFHASSAKKTEYQINIFLS